MLMLVVVLLAVIAWQLRRLQKGVNADRVVAEKWRRYQASQPPRGPLV